MVRDIPRDAGDWREQLDERPARGVDEATLAVLRQNAEYSVRDPDDEDGGDILPPDESPDQEIEPVEDDGSGEEDDESDDEDDDDDDASDDESSESDEERADVSAEEVAARFKDTIHGARLVVDWRTNKVIGIGTWAPDKWGWQITEFETPVQDEYRQAGIDLLVDLAAQVTGYVVTPPSNLDEAVDLVSEAVDPRSILLKLCNAAAQGLAHHCGLTLIAPALGSFVEQLLTPLVDPPNQLTDVPEDLQVLDVTVDVATGQLTPAVYDLAADEVDAALLRMTQGLSQAEFDEIAEAIRRGVWRLSLSVDDVPPANAAVTDGLDVTEYSIRGYAPEIQSRGCLHCVGWMSSSCNSPEVNHPAADASSLAIGSRSRRPAE